MISVIAHRGASRAFPENTVDAFAAAVRVGADGVELDVRRSADGALVVRHDPTLPDGRVVANTVVADLPDWLPLLDAALDACHGISVNIEIKNLPHEPGWDPTEAIAVDVARLAGDRPAAAQTGHISVSAFTLATIDAVRAAEPALPTGWLTLAGYDQLAAVETAADRGHAALHPHHHGVSAAVVDAAHDARLAVVTWTVDEPDRLRAMADMGVDAVITNVPDVALDVLAPWRQGT
ncbi:MAG: glycerophosphodiester phosphodiesterase [Actinobacteria bacterium]|nr:glycerophosphodiester phosphodiesterase [Actinomycetota bacterium]